MALETCLMWCYVWINYYFLIDYYFASQKAQVDGLSSVMFNSLRFLICTSECFTNLEFQIWKKIKWPYYSHFCWFNRFRSWQTWFWPKKKLKITKKISVDEISLCKVGTGNTSVTYTFDSRWFLNVWFW